MIKHYRIPPILTLAIWIITVIVGAFIATIILKSSINSFRSRMEFMELYLLLLVVGGVTLFLSFLLQLISVIVLNSIRLKYGKYLLWYNVAYASTYVITIIGIQLLEPMFRFDDEIIYIGSSFFIAGLLAWLFLFVIRKKEVVSEKPTDENLLDEKGMF